MQILTEIPQFSFNFFRSFFTVYESMKINRDKFVKRIDENNKHIDELKSNKIKIQNEEKILENGLTSNSIIEIKASNVNIDPNLYYQGNSIPSISLIFNLGNNDYQFTINSLNIDKKLTIKLDSMNSLDNPMKIFFKNNLIDQVNIKETLENKVSSSYNLPGNINLSLSFIWINSRVNYYNKKITTHEGELEELKEYVNVLNNCILHIQDTFKMYFTKINENEQGRVDYIDSKDDNNQYETNGTIRKQIEISDKIENYVLKIIGKELITWSNIVYFLNKVMMFTLIIIFFGR